MSRSPTKYLVIPWQGVDDWQNHQHISTTPARPTHRNTLHIMEADELATPFRHQQRPLPNTISGFKRPASFTPGTATAAKPTPALRQSKLPFQRVTPTAQARLAGPPASS